MGAVGNILIRPAEIMSECIAVRKGMRRVAFNGAASCAAVVVLRRLCAGHRSIERVVVDSLLGLLVNKLLHFMALRPNNS